jgi:hypothetical protein
MKSLDTGDADVTAGGVRLGGSDGEEAGERQAGGVPRLRIEHVAREAREMHAAAVAAAAAGRGGALLNGNGSSADKAEEEHLLSRTALHPQP